MRVQSSELYRKMLSTYALTDDFTYMFAVEDGEWMDLRNSNGFELRNFYFITV